MVGLIPSESLFLALLVTVVAGSAVALVYLVWLGLTVRFRRRTRERIVISQLAAVLAQDAPLPAGLRAAATSERGRTRRLLEALAESTARGEPLATALRYDFAECSGMTRSLIAAGQQTQQLPKAVALAEQALIERDLHELRIGRGAAVYMLTVLMLTAGLVTMLMVVIIPKYKEIFADFATMLPPVTVLVINGARAITGMGALIVTAVLVSGPLATYLQVRPRRPENPRWTSELADTFRWYLPGWGRMERAEGLTLALRTMRVAVAAGVPLADAAKAAAEIDVNIHLRDRLRRFAELVREGADGGQAARRAELGAMTVLALGAGGRTGDLAAALRYAGDYYESVLSRWCLVLRQVAWPACTLVMAVLVGTVVLAMFTPLIALIDAASSW